MECASPTCNRASQLELFFEPYLKAIEKALGERLSRLNPDNSLHQAILYSLNSGGKRFRPALVMMISESLGKGLDVSPSALAIEYFHTATLIADDLPCMDNDDMRRNRPSLHKAFGESTALLASYALIAEGFGLIAENGEVLNNASGDGKTAALEAFKIASYNTGIHGATGGQFFDLYPKDLTESSLKEIHHMKTTSLFEIAFAFGWLFGGGIASDLPYVKSLASSFGTAFQIADDFDDFESDTQENRMANKVILLGPDLAFNELEREISAFNDILVHLKIESQAFKGIGKYLLEWGRAGKNRLLTK